jgi:hypothetical protein
VSAALVVTAFALGVAGARLLSRRDARERDTRRVAGLAAELSALADPAGVGAPEIDRGPLCCRDGGCAGLFSRSQRVSAPAEDVLASYRRALERGGWRTEGVDDASSFAKEIGGRRASASVHVGGDPATAVVTVHLDAESC